MIPFRVYSKEEKTTWVVVNHNPGANGGTYLAYREDHEELDGVLELVATDQLLGMKMVNFIEEAEGG
jgi:hypothetical protein